VEEEKESIYLVPRTVYHVIEPQGEIPTTRPPPPPQPRCRNERRPGDVGRGICYDDGTAYYMNNIAGKFSRDFPQEDAIQCYRECTRDRRCKFWTFDRAHEWCYLKTCRQNVKNGRSQAHYISGDKRCRPPQRLSVWHN